MMILIDGSVYVEWNVESESTKNKKIIISVPSLDRRCLTTQPTDDADAKGRRAEGSGVTWQSDSMMGVKRKRQQRPK